MGGHFEASLARRMGEGRTWLWSEMSSHLYGAQRLYPCILALQNVCFSTSQRSIFGAGLGVRRMLRAEGQSGGSGVPYVVAGLAAYVSTRTAEKYSDCDPSSLCPAAPIRHDFVDTDFGVTLGFGQSWTAGRNSLFVESRFHQPLVKQHPGDPLTAFRLLPLTIGMRF